jgi:hypothetical protein
MAERVRKFRRAYIIQDGHDFSALNDFVEELVFMTNGSERFIESEENIRESLTGFDPISDCIIPVGKNTFNIMVGKILKETFPGMKIWFGLYNIINGDERGYRWTAIQF